MEWYAKQPRAKMEPDDQTAELFNRIRKALGETRTNEVLDRIDAHIGAKEALGISRLAVTFDPQWPASLLLLLWKKKSAEGDVRKESLTRAKLAATMFNSTKSLELCLHLIMLAVRDNDKQFFIDFGKCLSDEVSPELFSKYERDVAEIVLQLDENCGMLTSEGVRKLHKRGHTGMTEENLRNWKSKLLQVKPEFDEISKRIGLVVAVA
jgi:hypothetical protein